jgi:hypothetical protein
VGELIDALQSVDNRNDLTSRQISQSYAKPEVEEREYGVTDGNRQKLLGVFGPCLALRLIER